MPFQRSYQKKILVQSNWLETWYWFSHYAKGTKNANNKSVSFKNWNISGKQS